MTFGPDDALVPVALPSDEDLPRPLRAANVDRDQAAVAPQEALPPGSGGEWPCPSN